MPMNRWPSSGAVTHAGQRGAVQPGSWGWRQKVSWVRSCCSARGRAADLNLTVNAATHERRKQIENRSDAIIKILLISEGRFKGIKVCRKKWPILFKAEFIGYICALVHFPKIVFFFKKGVLFLNRAGSLGHTPLCRYFWERERKRSRRKEL